MEAVKLIINTIKVRFKGIRITGSDNNLDKYIQAKKRYDKYPQEFKDAHQESINGLPSRPRMYNEGLDFFNRWNCVQDINRKIIASISIVEIKENLDFLQLFLESQANQEKIINCSYLDAAGKLKLAYIGRDISIDRFFEERVLTKVRQSIKELEKLEALSILNDIVITQRQAETKVLKTPNGQFERLSTQREVMRNEKPSSQLSVPEFRKLADIFKDPKDLSAATAFLSKIDKPVVNSNSEWIAKYRGHKSVAVVWITVLERKGWLKPIYYKMLVPLLNSYFPGLEMGKDAGMFNKVNEVQLMAKNELEKMIPVKKM